MDQPLILEIKGNSLDDGPGIRSVVFFKGCPISCIWCHNPESKNPYSELSYDASKCINCGECQKVCTINAIAGYKTIDIDRKKCNLCFACVDVCPSKALTRVGFSMSVNEITERVLKDKEFYNVSGGGVTLSGGEPTMFPVFIGQLLSKLKENKIHTLLETCGQFKLSLIKKHILPFIDLIYYDLKLIDSDRHRKYCGVSNHNILGNFKSLYGLSQKMDFILIPRTPLIPDITDTEENLMGIAEFLSEIGVREAHLLPYNPLWYEKEEKLGIESEAGELKGKRWQCYEKIKKCKEIFENCKISIK